MQHNTTVEATQPKPDGRAGAAVADKLTPATTHGRRTRAGALSEKRRQLIAALLEDARLGAKPYVRGYDVDRGAE